MKNLHRLCAGFILALVFALPVSAGQIPCGVIDPPPSPEPTTAPAPTGDEVTEVALSLISDVLALF